MKTRRLCPAGEQIRWLHSARSISSAPIGASLWNVGGGGDASCWETHLLHTRSHLRPQTSASSAPLGCKAPSCFRPGMSGSRHKLLVQTLLPRDSRCPVQGPRAPFNWLLVVEPPGSDFRDSASLSGTAARGWGGRLPSAGGL